MENYLHMDWIYERMNRVTICETRHKRPLIKRTNDECLQLCWCALHVFKLILSIMWEYMLTKHTLLFGQVTMGRSGWCTPTHGLKKASLRRVYLPDPIELDISHHNSSGLGFKPNHWVRRRSAVTTHLLAAVVLKSIHILLESNFYCQTF